ncbi:putative ABC transporter substrate binding lipoprotein [Vallitalea longa]|uniref:ABC transporter substrate binding lipoprotein n=1 Tax=Vallitalea longa TaxID=2936439 RepID=A0A9W5Y9G6_9FIRM|nr:ABC transporter substrate-binding protein [Vallitalea longa]GKX29740.1 putative ABC transporter substrate binding lipoprotein [Vallitalea longa]
MKKRKLVLWVVLIAMLISIAGCGKKADTKDDNTKDVASETDDSKGTEKDNGNEQIPTLIWNTVGNGMPTNYDKWQAHINEYLEEKIGVHVDVHVIPWGEWDDKKSLIVNSGEYFDILFTNEGRYNAEVKLGTFMDITDLLQTEAPDLYNYIPEDYWKAVSIDGKIYSVPTYKDSSATQYLVWDTAMVEKYDIDIQNLKSLEQLTEPFRKIRDGENVAPFKLYKNGLDYVYVNYDSMQAGLPALGVRFDDENMKVVNTLEQEDVLERLNILHQWYEEGIINADAPALDEQSGYRVAFIAQGWPSAAKTTWGPNTGIDAEAVQLYDTIVSNTTVGGSLNGIYSGTKYPEKCIQLLDLINKDSYVRDAFYYGLEGDNFEYTSDGKVHKNNSDWNMAGYTQGTFFNVTQEDIAEFNQWDEVKELNANAIPSTLIGFSLDSTNIENELAECRAVYLKYRSELTTGAKEPSEIIKNINDELDAAGFQKILDEAQKQVDAFKK